MVILGKEISNVWIAIACVIAAGICILIILSIPTCSKPVTPTVVINQAQAAMEKQLKEQIKEKDIVILDYKNKLVVSQGKYNVLVDKYNKLQREKDNVKPPVTNEETRNRFIAAGYPPLPVK